MGKAELSSTSARNHDGLRPFRENGAEDPESFRDGWFYTWHYVPFPSAGRAGADSKITVEPIARAAAPDPPQMGAAPLAAPLPDQETPEDQTWTYRVPANSFPAS